MTIPGYSSPNQPRRNSLFESCASLLGTLAILSLFLLIGAGLAVWGWFVLQDARASAGWPTAEGVVTESSVRHSSDSDGGDSYIPEITYQYQVNSVNYEDTTIKFGENSYSSRRRAEQIAADYPVGRQVAVYYEPEDPTNAVLEPGVTSGSYILLAIGAVFILIPLVFGPVALLLRLRSRD